VTVARVERLVSLEIRIRTTDDPDQLADRIREATALITGREALEEFRVRSTILAEPKGPRRID
jgi:hypothetical protein